MSHTGNRCVICAYRSIISSLVSFCPATRYRPSSSRNSLAAESSAIATPPGRPRNQLP